MPSPHFLRGLSQFLEEVLKTATTILQHAGTPCDFTDAYIQLFRDFPLWRALRQFLDKLPALGNRIDLLRSKNILQELVCLFLILNRGE